MNKVRKKKKNSSSPLFLFIFIFILGGIAASNFVGPTKGWMANIKENLTNSTDQSQKNNKEDSAPGSEVSDSDTLEATNSNTSEEDKKEASTPNSPSKGTNEHSINAAYIATKRQAFYDEYMEGVKNLPQIGRRYPVVTIDNNIRDGVLTKKDEDNIYLSEVKPYNAKTSIHYSKLRPDMVKYFFPEKLAETHAGKMLEKYLSEKKVIDTVTDASISIPVSEKTDNAFYDITVSESSPKLAHAATEVNNYLKNQMRIASKKGSFMFADIDKCHAKQQGRAAVFYLYTKAGFVDQSEDYKLQIVDGLRRFWALRCKNNSVAKDSNAYLCVVGDSKIIGGSKVGKADEIFVQ